MTKLILIRGNSGSGKSSLAKELRERAKRPNRVALVEQDYLRRIVLREKEGEGTANLALIQQTVVFALERDYDVILEGILYSRRYRRMLMQLSKHADETFVFYLDVSLEETFKRHKKKPNAHEFGETELRSWYKPSDVLKRGQDIVLPETFSMEQSLMEILKHTEL